MNGIQGPALAGSTGGAPVGSGAKPRRNHRSGAQARHTIQGGSGRPFSRRNGGLNSLDA